MLAMVARPTRAQAVRSLEVCFRRELRGACAGDVCGDEGVEAAVHALQGGGNFGVVGFGEGGEDELVEAEFAVVGGFVGEDAEGGAVGVLFPGR